MSDEQKRLALAKKYIAQGRGAIARPILERLAHLPEAQDLLVVLDSLPTKKKRVNLTSIILASVMGICAMAFFFTVGGEEESAQATQADQGTRLTSQRDVANLIKGFLLSEGYPVDTVGMVGSTLVVEAPVSSNERDNTLAGAILGSVTATYEDDIVAVDPPRQIKINFNYQGERVASITVQYADSLAFLQKNMTVEEFIARWEVE